LPPGERAIFRCNCRRRVDRVRSRDAYGQFLDVGGEEVSERQNLSVIFNKVRFRSTPSPCARAAAPGLENRTDSRVLPTIWMANQALDDLLKRRKPILTQSASSPIRTSATSTGPNARHRPTPQDPEPDFPVQRSQGLHELYDRVGDLVAFDLVNEHFRLLQEIIAPKGGRREDHRRCRDGDFET